MSARISLAPFITDGGDWRLLIEQLTGVPVALPLENLLGPLELPYAVIDPIMTQIWGIHDDAVTAAFTAGLACGLNPGKLLLVEAAEVN
jgi:hypothetical protein